MTLLRDIGEIVTRWLDVVATTIVAAFGRFVSPRVVRIVEESDGSGFTLRGPDHAGRAECEACIGPRPVEGGRGPQAGCYFCEPDDPEIG